jgi:MFS superfamily sulfate permease-like transporter
VIAAGGHGRMGTDIGDSLVAFALPEGGAGLLAQSMAPTLRTVGVLLVLLLAALLVLRLAPKNWFWYPLLAILTVTVTWVAWIASQSIPASLLTMVVAATVAWLITLGRNHRRRTTPRSESWGAA